MSEFLSIQQAMDKGEGEVSIRGWVYRERKSNKFAFIVVRDGTNIIQTVVKKADVTESVWEAANATAIEAAVTVTGTIKPDERAPTGFELVASDFSIVGESDSYPITKDQSTEFLQDVRHLWIRSRKLTEVWKVKAAILAAGREYFAKMDYVETTPPLMTHSNCEGGSELFEIDYFGKPAYMSQSAQLYLEALCYSLGKVYAITPSFRAEKSRTNRHLAEYWHMEGEEAFMGFDQLLDFCEGLISHMLTHVADNCAKELEVLGRDPEQLRKWAGGFPRITYDEALEILKKDGMEVEWGKDLRTLEEEQLMTHYDKPLIVTHYPKEVKAFYMEVDPTNPKVVLCCDILAPEGYGEVVGGSERSASYDHLIEMIKKNDEDPEHYGWYLDLRKYGSVQHSGFGLGVERIVRWFCGLENIRDSIPFPRNMTRIYP